MLSPVIFQHSPKSYPTTCNERRTNRKWQLKYQVLLIKQSSLSLGSCMESEKSLNAHSQTLVWKLGTETSSFPCLGMKWTLRLSVFHTWLLWIEMAHASLRGSCLREAIFPLPTLTLHLSGTTVTSNPDVNTTTGNPASITHQNMRYLYNRDTKTKTSESRFFFLLPLPLVSNFLTTPLAPFTRPRGTSMFFASITWNERKVPHERLK